MHASDVDASDLRAFVVDAHANGYATGSVVETSDRTKTVEYGRDDWQYVDRYVGSRDFVGFEVVRYRDESVWGMNYYGYLTDGEETADEIYGFLREALARVSTEHPFRGPPLDGDPYSYEPRSEGDIERFHGSETVSRSDRTVYEGFYRGGFVR